MIRILPLLIIQLIMGIQARSQSFNAEDLVRLSSLPSKNIDHYLKKKGLVLSSSKSDSSVMMAKFIPGIKGNENNMGKKSLELFIKDGSKIFTLRTLSLNEFREGEQYLIKSGFFYDQQTDITKASTVLFQKENIVIVAASSLKEGANEYRFELKEKAIPSFIGFAEDLLQFDSHELLVSYFGEQNVKKDRYYFSEHALKRCSVLFSGTNRQVVFVWDDEINLNNLAYILVSNALPTESAKNNSPLTDNNEWKLRNGIYPGMSLKELLNINETDFDIYGKNSDLAFLAKPNAAGKIDFKKTAVMFSCRDCFESKIFDRDKVSALDVAKENLSLRVFDVVLYPSIDPVNSVAENSSR